MNRRVWMWVGVVAAPVVFLAAACVGDEVDGQPIPFTTTTTSTVTPPNTTSASTTLTTSPNQSTTTTSPAPGMTSPPAGWSSAVVVDVIDGDTIDARLESGTVERVRLIGINSPEDGECFSTEASNGLAGLVRGETVILEPDVSNRDQFGRLLRYVWTSDDRLINVISVEEGWAIARDYPPDTSRSSELQAAEQRARDGGAGLWARDACGEALPADIQIVHVEYDAPGDDNFNLNQEWVEISNGDDVPVDLTGWVLKDESATHRYSFPAGFTLQPATTLTVYTGCGEDSDDALYWCVSGSAVWNNSGDTAFLLDPDGNIVFSYAYG